MVLPGSLDAFPHIESLLHRLDAYACLNKLIQGDIPAGDSLKSFNQVVDVHVGVTDDNHADAGRIVCLCNAHASFMRLASPFQGLEVIFR